MNDRSPEGSGIHAPALAPGRVLSPDAAKQVDAFVREAERAMPPWLHAELAKAARSGNTSALVGARYDAASRRWSRDDPSPPRTSTSAAPPGDRAEDDLRGGG